MYLGFLTVCLGDIPFEEKAKWAAQNGFSALEIGCWPKENSRDYSSSDFDVEHYTEKDIETIQKILTENQLCISSLAYYDNNLDENISTRERNNRHLLRCIDMASDLGVPSVGTFIGRDRSKSIEENFDLFEKVFIPIVDYAGERGIRLLIENCPMEGWQITGMPGTISFSPELWEEMFRRIPQKNFGINYDPSHLYLMQMDYLTPLLAFRDRIYHVHAKDGLIDRKKLAYYGTFNRQIGRELTNGYWECRMPGRGGVDFEKVVKTLRQIGYDGVISIEHEDPSYEGDLELVKTALLMSRDHLRQYL